MIRIYYISYNRNIYYVTLLFRIKKIHVRVGISSNWHIFHCVDWAWGTTCGTLGYVCHRVRILIDWKILKIAALNLERLNIAERLNVSINRRISSRHFKLKQGIIDPLFGNSSLAFNKAGELFFKIGSEYGASYSLGFNQDRICYGIGTIVSNLIFFSADDFFFDLEWAFTSVQPMLSRCLLDCFRVFLLFEDFITGSKNARFW